MTRIVLMCLLGATAGGVIGLGSAHPVSACSCASFTDAEAAEYADAVFIGTLVEVITEPGDTYSSMDPARFIFDVDEVFEGDVFARQSVVTARDGASCGLEISGRGPFVVFARADADGLTSGGADGELYSGLCSGTRALADGGPPAVFADSFQPLAGSSPIGRSDDGTSTVVSIAVVAGALAALAFGAFALRARQHS